MQFWNFTQNEEDIELRITGEIMMEDDFWAWLFGSETTTPKSFRKELAKYKGKDITVWINSPGGDVYAASSIYTSLKEHKGKVTVKVDGYACSAASVIAMAGDEILMSPTSIIMIHNPWGAFAGEAADMRHAAEILDQVKETILNAYQLKTKKSRSKISQMMDEETWMSSTTAIKEGFADNVLYKEEASVENNIMFSRMAIQNNANDSIKKFIEQYNKRIEESIDKKDANKKVELPDENPVNLYKSKVANNERRIKNYGL